MRIEAVVGTAVLAVLAWGGCGSSSEQGEVHEAHEMGEHEEGEHGEHEGEEGEEHEHGEGHENGEHGEHEHAPGPVSDFHAVLSPLWHADAGAARTDGACNAVTDMRAKAAAIETGAVPEHADESAYRQAAAGLKSAVEALATACGAPGRPDFETRFRGVHEAFHRVAETAEGEEEH